MFLHVQTVRDSLGSPRYFVRHTLAKRIPRAVGRVSLRSGNTHEGRTELNGA